jgi:thioredoxin-like negative regulator of GroEL
MNVNIIIFIIITIIGAGIVYYLYKPKNKFVTNNEYVDTETGAREIQLILFYVNWCPYSQTALTEWNKIQSNIATANPKYVIDFTEIDCDKNSEMANSFKIKEYPTIFLVKGVTRYEYDANLSEKTLNLFINTVMKE